MYTFSSLVLDKNFVKANNRRTCSRITVCKSFQVLGYVLKIVHHIRFCLFICFGWCCCLPIQGPSCQPFLPGDKIILRSNGTQLVKVITCKVLPSMPIFNYTIWVSYLKQVGIETHCVHVIVMAFSITLVIGISAEVFQFKNY